MVTIPGAAHAAFGGEGRLPTEGLASSGAVHDLREPARGAFTGGEFGARSQTGDDLVVVDARAAQFAELGRELAQEQLAATRLAGELAGSARHQPDERRPIGCAGA